MVSITPVVAAVVLLSLVGGGDAGTATLMRVGIAGWLLAHVGTRLLSRSWVVHTDGPRSVAGAFTVAELRELAAEAGLVGAEVAWRWPFRMLLTWRRPS